MLKKLLKHEFRYYRKFMLITMMVMVVSVFSNCGQFEAKSGASLLANCARDLYTEDYYDSVTANAVFQTVIGAKPPTAADRRYGKLAEFNLPRSRAYAELDRFIAERVTE